ncbi:tetratricopeptide repeat protein [Gluconobacter sphaericus]|nr:tetratricopeptide repeat protein [Gluconobacter sphaericus]MBF0884337.1 tetratricopeptide repeat protein [Gluconobacter sphaericus]MBS1085235.1 tetratricopeptide repeat protein [Gluconobacter sphaericus]MBS1098979.1 tetratricopeptide repeat protein [Gluconobacter sphaericus]
MCEAFAATVRRLYGRANSLKTDPAGDQVADDFITQVNEEMQAQRLRAMARRIGAVVGVVALFGAIGGGVWGWNSHARHAAQQAASARYFTAMTALSDPKHDAAATQKATATFQDLAEHGPVGVRSYAALRLADLQSQAHQTDAALKTWQGVADDNAADPALRDMARYMSLNSRTATADPKTLRPGYEALAQGGGAWAPLAQEGLVALDLRPGATADQQKEARRILTQIVGSENATEGVRARAQALLETFGDAG